MFSISTFFGALWSYFKARRLKSLARVSSPHSLLDWPPPSTCSPAYCRSVHPIPVRRHSHSGKVGQAALKFTRLSKFPVCLLLASPFAY